MRATRCFAPQACHKGRPRLCSSRTLLLTLLSLSPLCRPQPLKHGRLLQLQSQPAECWRTQRCAGGGSCGSRCQCCSVTGRIRLPGRSSLPGVAHRALLGGTQSVPPFAVSALLGIIFPSIHFDGRSLLSQGQGQGREYPGQRIPMPQVQQFFLEGMRPEMGHMGNLARTMAQPAQMQR